MYSSSVGGNILYVAVKSTWPVVQVFCFFIDLLSGRSICYQKWGVEVSYYYWLLSTSSFNSVMVYFIYLGALMLGSYIFIIVICSWWIVLLSLYSGLLYLLWQFWLKVCFIWCKYGHPCSLLFDIYVKCLLPPFIFIMKSESISHSVVSDSLWPHEL